MPISRVGSSARMVGRQRELAVLRETLSGAVGAEQPEVALILGEAGIGKSRLLRELIEHAGAARVFVGQAREEDSGASFGLLRDMAAREVEAWSEVPEALRQHVHPLAHLLSPLLAIPDHPDDGHDHRTDELALAGVALLRHLVEDGPALLVFEDLHWADAESLQLIKRLAAVEGLPALIVGTFRSEEYDRRHPLAGLLAHLERHRRVVRVELARLSRDELRELAEALVGAPVGDDVADLLHERTQGNPFFLEELVAAVGGGEGSAIDPATLAEAPLPWTAAEAVLGRLQGLPRDARAIIAAAAVLGERFGFALLAAVVDSDEDSLLDSLATLVRMRILEERAPDEFAFRHALTREAVAGQLLARQRRRIHQRALEALARTADADPGVMVRHAHGAGDAAATVRYAVLAAERALRDGAPRHALRMARLGRDRNEGEMELLAISTRATEQIGDLAAARDHAERWTRAARDSADAGQEAKAHCRLAWILWSLGDRPAAWRELHAAEAATAALDEPAVLARVRAVRAQLHLLVGDNRAAIEHADRALELADATGDRRVRGHALVTKGTALTDLQAGSASERVDAAVDLLAMARAEAEAVGDIDTLTRALNNSIFPGQGVTTLAETRALTEDLRRVVERYGIERFAGKLATIDAYTCILEGDAHGARDALARRAPAEGTLDAFFWGAIRAYVEVETGDLDEGVAVLGDQEPLLDRLEPGEPHVDHAVSQAALAAATGDAEAAAAALHRVGEAIRHVTVGSAVAWWDVAVCALEAGLDPDVVERLRAEHRPLTVRRSEGAVAHLDARLHAAHGRHDDALACFRRAAAEPLGGRPAAMLAAARTSLAEQLARHGELEEARERAAGVVDLLARWPGWRLRAAQALRRRLGEGDSPVHELLTARELDVCRLLARGFSNREIAEHLFISPKTASVHVSNILAKTGLRRRAQVAAWALEAGLDDG